MTEATRAPFSVPRGPAIALAALGPIAIGGILAVHAHDPRPMLAAPSIVFGVIAATGPALYIATATTGEAPPLAAMVRAFAVAFGAFGLALAGLILPAAFLALSSVSPTTPIAAASAAITAAGYLGMCRLASELRTATGPAAGGKRAARAALTSRAVFAVWAIATMAIAGRLWWDLAVEVAS